MEYTARFMHEDGQVLVDFPDCPGCQTFGDNEEHARQMAEEALEGWLETHLVGGKVPPRPKRHQHGIQISVRPQLAVALQIRWLRDDEGLTQTELAKRAKVAQQQIARLENPDGNPTIGTIEAVAAALQQHLYISLTNQQPRSFQVSPPARPKARAAKASRPSKRRRTDARVDAAR